MRIKSFKLFENSMQQFKEDIDDLLYPFIDSGYEVSNRLNGGGYLSIYTMDWKSKKDFKFISDDLFRIFDYLFENDIKKIGMEIETNKIHIQYLIKPDIEIDKNKPLFGLRISDRNYEKEMSSLNSDLVKVIKIEI